MPKLNIDTKDVTKDRLVKDGKKRGLTLKEHVLDKCGVYETEYGKKLNGGQDGQR